MTNSGTAPIGALAPLAAMVDVTVPPPLSGLDVASAYFVVVQPSGTQRPASTWPATLSNVTMGLVRMSHPYAAGDLPTFGTYTLTPWFVMANGDRWPAEEVFIVAVS